MLKVLGKKCRMFVIMAVLVQSIFCTQVFADDVIEEEVLETQIAVSETEVNSLPIGWQSKDIGDVGLAGYATYTDSTKLADKFTLSGAGKGINGNNDSFQFVYKKLSGDFSIEAYPKISLSGNQKIKAGIMIRESLYSDSAFVGMFATNNQEALIQSRKAWKKKVTTGYEKTRNLEENNALSFKLIRNGDKIVCFIGSSFEGWKQIGEPIQIDAGKTVYAGLCVTSEDKKVLSQSDFTGVGIQQNNSIYTKPYKSNTSINGSNQVNLALGKTNIIASYKEKSPATNAVDGKVNTVWSVDGAQHTFILDLENIYNISSFETILTKQEALKYTIETSVDSSSYMLVVDKASNTKKSKNHIDNINSVFARYIKLTVLGINKESFPKINIGEFKVMGSSEPVLEPMTFTISSISFSSNPFVNEEAYEAENCTYYTVRRKDQALVFGSNSSFIKEFSTEGYSDITIDIDRWTENCELDESFITEWFDGKNWEKLEEVNGNIWSQSGDSSKCFALPAAASNNKNCKIRIRTEKYDSDDMAFLDKVEVKGKYTKAPAAPKNLKSQIVTDNSAVIAWDESEDFLYGDYYDVYLDDGTRLGSAKDTRFLISDLEKGKAYKVYVKAVNAGGVSSEASNIISITTPRSDSNKTVYYEAEDGILSGDVCVVDDSECSGGKKVEKTGWNGILNMNLNCKNDGNYLLTVFYYSKDDFDFPSLSINGLGVDLYPCNLDYVNCSVMQRSFNVQLNAGDNVLSIYNPSFSNDNSIDRVAITPLQ